MSNDEFLKWNSVALENKIRKEVDGIVWTKGRLHSCMHLIGDNHSMSNVMKLK